MLLVLSALLVCPCSSSSSSPMMQMMQMTIINSSASASTGRIWNAGARSPAAWRRTRATALLFSKSGVFRFRNRFGLGSDLHVYGQALCNALESSSISTSSHKYRVTTALPWIWRDETVCGNNQ